MIAGGASVSALKIMRLIRHALREARDLTAAIQVLADRVDRFTGELACTILPSSGRSSRTWGSPPPGPSPSPARPEPGAAAP